MWVLQSEENNKRTYVNSIGSKCITNMVYIDKEGNKWWSFADLMTMPFARTFASSKIASLYALGFLKEDLNNHITGLKTILKSNDADKYEKAFAMVLDFESKADSAADPFRQVESMVCIYNTINDEEIDSFENNLQLRKMLLLEADPKAHAFFLNKTMTATEDYMQRLSQLSLTVLPKLPELSQASE